MKGRVLQMSNDDATERIIEFPGLWYEREIWVTTVIVVAHVHPAIEHYSLAVDRYNHAALPDFLPSSWKSQSNEW